MKPRMMTDALNFQFTIPHLKKISHDNEPGVKLNQRDEIG
jgi:hypothetical protein